MKTVRVCLMAVAAAFCALVLSPGVTRADTLTGSTGITWVFGTSTFATDTIADGSSLSCPSTSPICVGYSGYGSEAFSVGTSSISYTASIYPPGSYATSSFNGFDFTGLTFASGDSLTGFTLTTNISGLTDSDITFGSSFIDVNLANLPVNGFFTLDLTSGPTVSTPEPSSLALLGIGLLALLVGLARKRLVLGRFAAESAH
jgi:PEP-CTERM motif